jgi:hypothetical protein
LSAAALFRPFVCDDLPFKGTGCQSREGRNAILTDAVNAEAAVVCKPVHLKFPKPFLASPNVSATREMAGRTQAA